MSYHLHDLAPGDLVVFDPRFQGTLYSDLSAHVMGVSVNVVEPIIVISVCKDSSVGYAFVLVAGRVGYVVIARLARLS